MNYVADKVGCSSDTVRNRVIAMNIPLPENRGMIRHKEQAYQPPRESCLKFHSLLTTLVDMRKQTTITSKSLVGKAFKAANKGKLGLKKVALV